MADLATLQARLEEAEAAEHILLTGRREAAVGHGDKQVTYNRANLPALQAYIQRLRGEIARLQGRPGRRPIYPVFTS